MKTRSLPGGRPHLLSTAISFSVLASVVLLLTPSCAGSSNSPSGEGKAPGAENGACVDGDLCDFGLTCVSHVCVKGPWGEPSEGGPSPASGLDGSASNGGAIGSSGGAAGSSGGAANGGTAGSNGGTVGSNGGTVGSNGGAASGGTTGGNGGAVGVGGALPGTGGIPIGPTCRSGPVLTGTTCFNTRAYCYCTSGSHTGECVLKADAPLCCPGGC